MVAATGALKFLVIYSQKWYKFVSRLLKFLVEVNDMSREPTRAAILIRESRKRAGLTQQALAEKLGITTSAVCNYESGASFPKAWSSGFVIFLTLHPATCSSVNESS